METMSNGSNALAIVPHRDGLLEVKTLHNLMVDLRNDVLIVDIDYGIIPGTGDKPTLYLAGMEKIMRALYVVPEYIERHVIRDYDKGIFHYEYECRLVDCVTGQAIPGGRGLGMCTTMESSFRWRWVKAEQLPQGIDRESLEKRPGSISEFAFAVVAGKTSGQYAKPAEYWQSFREAIASGHAKPTKRKTKDGTEKDAWEISTDVYRIPNPDIFDQINAVMKRGKKRSLGDAVKGAAAISEFFTVDLEELHRFDDVVEGEYVVLDEQKSLPPTVSQPPPASNIIEDSEPPKPPVASKLAAEAEAQKLAESRLAVLVESMEKNNISLPTALQVLKIEEKDKYNFDLWKTHGDTGKAIAEKVAHILAQNDKPATPKNGTAKTTVSPDDIHDLDALCPMWWDTSMHCPILPDVMLGNLGKNFWGDFSSKAQGQEAVMKWVMANRPPLIAISATYHKQYTTLWNGKLEVRYYDFRKQVAAQCGTDWDTFTTDWTMNTQYPLDPAHWLIVDWLVKAATAAADGETAIYYNGSALKTFPVETVTTDQASNPYSHTQDVPF